MVEEPRNEASRNHAPKRCFITGLGGQDGSYLAEQLLARGDEVHALVLSGEPGPYTPEGVTLHLGDLTDHDRTAALLRELAPDEVYNLAAISSVAQSWDEPDLVRAVNADAAIALMQAAVSLPRPARFLQASSAEIFGQPEHAPQNESTPIRPVNPYGEAKATAHLAVGAAREAGVFAVSAVLYNHESPRRPERFVTRKITSGVAAIARGEADELVLGNLDAKRDWGWAPDYTEAMIRALRHDLAQDYVIATGVGHTVRDFVAAAFAAVGIEDWASLVRSDPAFVRPVDPTDLVGDASRAHRDLGWAPTKGFAEVVSTMVAAELGGSQLSSSKPSR